MQDPPDAEAYLESLHPAEQSTLYELAHSDRAALSEHLKQAGFTKLGQRMKVEACLRRTNVQAKPAAAPSESAAHATSVVPAAQTVPAMLAVPAVPAVPAAPPLPTPPPAALPPLPEVLTAEFVAAACFDGARTGHVFKMGENGLGYYRDVDSRRLRYLALDKLERKMAGKLSWLTEEAEAEHAAAAEAAAAAAAAPAAAAAAADEEQVMARQQVGEGGGGAAQGSGSVAGVARLHPALARKVWVAPKPRPFAPVLHEGKHADTGYMVKVVDGQHAGEFGQVEAIKQMSFYVRLESGHLEAGLHFDSLRATLLKPRDFEQAKRQWAEQEEQRIWVERHGVAHKDAFKERLNAHRLTYNPEVREGASAVKPALGAPLPLKMRKHRVPIPSELLRKHEEATSGGRGVGVADRSCHGGWGRAPLYTPSR